MKVLSKVLQEFAKIVRKEVTDAINTLQRKAREGINNLVQVSDSLNKALSSLKSNITQAGNAIATAFAPVLEALIPLMNNVLNTVINVSNGIAQVTASLFGNAQTFKKATKVNEDYAKSVKGVGNANKGMLASFDELNVLSDNNGAGALSPEDMFSTEAIDQQILNMTGRLKDLWDTNNLEGLSIFGKEIGENIKKQIDELPTYEWGKNIGQKVSNALALANGFLSTTPTKNLGQKISQLLLGAIDGTDPKEVGRFFANILNNAVALATGFLEDMDANNGWVKLGDWFADSFNEMVENVDAEEIGNAISMFCEGVLEMLIDFLVKVDWEKLGEKIGECLANIDWIGIWGKILTVILLAWNAVREVALGVIVAIIKAILIWIGEKAVDLYNKVKEIMTNLTTSVSSKGDDIKKAIADIWQKVKNWFNTNVKPKLTVEYWKEKLSSVSQGITEVFKGAFNGVIGMCEKAVNWIIGALNRISVTLPDWDVFGDLAGKSYGINIAPVKLDRLASGGVLDKPTPILAGEYAGASQNPEIVAPQKLLLQTSTQANVPVMNSIEEMGDKLVTALNSLGVYAEFDYSKLKVGLDNENYRVGGKLYGI